MRRHPASAAASTAASAAASAAAAGGAQARSEGAIGQSGTGRASDRVFVERGAIILKLAECVSSATTASGKIARHWMEHWVNREMGQSNDALTLMNWAAGVRWSDASKRASERLCQAVCSQSRSAATLASDKKLKEWARAGIQGSPNRIVRLSIKGFNMKNLFIHARGASWGGADVPTTFAAAAALSKEAAITALRTLHQQTSKAPS